MSKKKKHYKQSISGKLRNDAEKFFKQYGNNVTRASFIKNYDKFIKFCRTEYDCKTKEECAEHIEDYIEYLKEKRPYRKHDSYIYGSGRTVSRDST